MSTQTLKFDLNGSEAKMFWRYPDRLTAKISEEDRQAIAKENEEIQFKRDLVNEAIKSILTAANAKASEGETATETLTVEDLGITFKREHRPVRRGTGPITAEFHIAIPDGTNEDGKTKYKEHLLPSTVRFHSSSIRNSYEKARQYAIHNYFKINNLLEGSPLYESIVECYENRGGELPKFCRDVADIEKLTI